MNTLHLTVGMEIHIELKTKTKMFCGCLNDPFHSKPNANICPICYGLPGSLPLINKEAVMMTVKLGQALNGQIGQQSFWARKNYFYPDLPKGYQISQSSRPVVSGATLTVEGESIRITRIHLEEDAGKLLHGHGQANSSVDFNRAGVPLIEIVTEPDFDSAASAKRFCQELQAIVRHLDLSQADMEKGEMRCEANISVSHGGEELGTKVEVKNLNSFRSVERAIQFEFDRQSQLLGIGEKVIQETRTWDEAKGDTKSMRTKETSADYRYFPEPDLPVVEISTPAKIKTLLPEDRRLRLITSGVDHHLAVVLVKRGIDELVLAIDRSLVQAAAKLLVAKPNFPALKAEQLSQLIGWQKAAGWSKATTAMAARELAAGQEPEKVKEQFSSKYDIGKLALAIIADNPAAVADYRAGKQSALNFLVGSLLKQTGGKASVEQARQLLLDRMSQDD